MIQRKRETAGPTAREQQQEGSSLDVTAQSHQGARLQLPLQAALSSATEDGGASLAEEEEEGALHDWMRIWGI